MLRLIYALPGQRPAQWDQMLRQAIGFGTGHLSLYQLTIEPGTRFETMVAKRDLEPLDPDAAADLFEITAALTEQAGIPAYEISNHARPGEESRHNLAYWRYLDYAGIGPGAHGRRLGMRTSATASGNLSPRRPQSPWPIEERLSRVRSRQAWSWAFASRGHRPGRFATASGSRDWS